MSRAAITLVALLALVTLAVVTQGGTIREAQADTDGAAMSLRVDASQTIGCIGGPVQGKVCVQLGAKFDVIVVADEVPLTNGYILAQVWIDYGSLGLADKQNITVQWADCDVATFLTAKDVGSNGLTAGCLTGLLPPQPASFYKGDLYSFSLTCTDTQSSNTISLLPTGDAIAGTSGAVYTEAVTGRKFIPLVSGIQVNCVPPPPVGGVSLDEDLRGVPLDMPESSWLGIGAGWLVAGSVAIALAAAGTAAVAWRRR